MDEYSEYLMCQGGRRIIRMHWHDLLFMHWPVAPELLKSLIPAPLELDIFEGDAWIGVVPFRLSRVAPRGIPPDLCGLEFPELNVRTYVRQGGVHGVWFFSLDASSRLAVHFARAWYALPYYHADMTVKLERNRIRYRSRRLHRNSQPAELEMDYEPAGDAFLSRPGTLDSWLTERYCLFSVSRKGMAGWCTVQHKQWPLQEAVADIRINTMTEQLGLKLPECEPVLHFARELAVTAGPVRPLNNSPDP